MLQKIDEQEYSNTERRSIDTLRELVRTKSLTGEEMPGQKVIAKMLSDAGAKVEWLEVDTVDLFKMYPDIAQYPSHWQHDLVLPYDKLPTLQSLAESGMDRVLNYKNRPNVIARWNGTGQGRSLILNGHIDTVTIEPQEAWTQDPFGAEIMDGKLYGRGSVDMKGGLAAAIAAMGILQERGENLKGDVIIQSVVNEEHAGNGTLDLVRRGITADAAIVLEPTDSTIATGSAGGLYWTVNVSGVVRSPGARWVGDEIIGVSAIEMLGPVIKALKQIERDYIDQNGVGAFSLVIGQVTGGHYDTATAGFAVLRGTAYFSEESGTVNQIMDRFRSIVGIVAAEDPFLSKYPIEVQFLHHDDATRQSETPQIAKELSGFLAQKGMDSEIRPGNFACDVRHLVNRGNIPSIVFGPGKISQAHKSDEHIHVREYLNFVGLLAEFILYWCNAEKVQTS